MPITFAELSTDINANALPRLRLLHEIFIIVPTNDNVSLNDIYTGFRTETAKNSYFTEGSHRMEYRNLGKTGLSVSEIGFGPEWMTGTPEETRAIAERYARQE